MVFTVGASSVDSPLVGVFTLRFIVDVTEFLKHECEIPADGFILAPNSVHQTRFEDVHEDDELDAKQANAAAEEDKEDTLLRRRSRL